MTKTCCRILNRRPYLQNAQSFLCRSWLLLFVLSYVARKYGEGEANESEVKSGRRRRGFEASVEALSMVMLRLGSC